MPTLIFWFIFLCDGAPTLSFLSIGCVRLECFLLIISVKHSMLVTFGFWFWSLHVFLSVSSFSFHSVWSSSQRDLPRPSSNAFYPFLGPLSLWPRTPISPQTHTRILCFQRQPLYPAWNVFALPACSFQRLTVLKMLLEVMWHRG